MYMALVLRGLLPSEAILKPAHEPRHFSWLQALPSLCLSTAAKRPLTCVTPLRLGPTPVMLDSSQSKLSDTIPLDTVVYMHWGRCASIERFPFQ